MADDTAPTETEMHPNPSMQRLQLLAAGETIDLIYLVDDDFDSHRVLAEAGSTSFEGSWVHCRDGGDNRLTFPAHRVKEIQHGLEVPEIEQND